MDTKAQIETICNYIRDFLVEKNKSYGDSAFKPVRIFSQAEDIEQLKVRIDDKLSRISRVGDAQFNGIKEDTLLDLIGYLVLLYIVTKNKNDRPGQFTSGLPSKY